MDRETAAVVANARDLAQWAAQQVVETDRLIEVATYRPLSPAEHRENLQMQRELLVRLSQREILTEWAVETWRAPWWVPGWRWWLRFRGPRRR